MRPIGVFNTSPTKRSRPRSRSQLALGVLVVGLLVLSVCAALPIHPQGPFDARDHSRLAGMRLERSGWSSLIEPWVAPFHILAGAPDFRVAGVVVLIWLVLGVSAWRLVSDSRGQTVKFPWLCALRAVGTGIAAGLVLVMWLVCAMMIPLSGWRLVVDDARTLIADLQSHTFSSHDGLASKAENLAWHSAAGINVVALTEHAYATTPGADETERAASAPSPAVILGTELRSNRTGTHLLGLGLQSDHQCPTNPVDSTFPSRYATCVHEQHRGAVIAMAYKLRLEDVIPYADAGIDAFEIVNFGHPRIPSDVRNRLLEVTRERGLPLLASSDWHGWGGTSRTWNVIRTPEGVPTSPDKVAALAVKKLRNRDAADIIPVVAGYLGSPSLLRGIFSPVIEPLRYAAELSLAQVISWWVWSALAIALVLVLSRFGFAPAKSFLALLLALVGSGLLWAGLRLILATMNGLTTSGFPREIGTYISLLGGAALLAAVWLGISVWRARRSRLTFQPAVAASI
jgi:predicted metal-dependent phosphoesterase TrpH